MDPRRRDELIRSADLTRYLAERVIAAPDEALLFTEDDLHLAIHEAISDLRLCRDSYGGVLPPDAQEVWNRLVSAEAAAFSRAEYLAIEHRQFFRTGSRDAVANAHAPNPADAFDAYAQLQGNYAAAFDSLPTRYRPTARELYQTLIQWTDSVDRGTPVEAHLKVLRDARNRHQDLAWRAKVDMQYDGTCTRVTEETAMFGFADAMLNEAVLAQMPPQCYTAHPGETRSLY